MGINSSYSSRQTGGAAVDSGALQQLVVAAQAAAVTADTDANLALRYANELPGVDITPGVQSARNHAEVARLRAVAAAKVPKTTVDTAASPFTPTSGHLGRKIVLTGTTGSIVLPVGLDKSPAADGGPGLNWVSFVNRSSGAWAWTAGSSATQAPSVLTVQAFPYSTGAPVSPLTSSFTLTAPAGTGRKVTFFLFSIFNATDLARNIALTVGSSSNLSKAQADTSTDPFSGAKPICASAWTCDLADSAGVATTHALALTTGAAQSFVLCAFVTGNTNSLAAVAGVSNTVAAVTAAVTKTPAEINDVILFGLAQQGDDALPLTLSSTSGLATQSFNGAARLAGAGRVLKDVAYIFGFEPRGDTVAQTYTQTSAKSAFGATLVGLAKPLPGAAATLNPTSPTSIAAGKHATAWCDPDGVTWDVEA